MFLRLPYFACQVSNKLVTRFKTHCDVVLKTYHCLLTIESSLSSFKVITVHGKVRTNADYVRGNCLLLHRDRSCTVASETRVSTRTAIGQTPIQSQGGNKRKD